ncbi:MAG TPA: hypothetical protein VF183_00450 [Acidimicrobiales bacterium]
MPYIRSGRRCRIDESDYEKLSQIAPTVAQSGDYEDGGELWQQQVLDTLKALGREAQARAIVDEVEGAFAAARQACSTA